MNRFAKPTVANGSAQILWYLGNCGSGICVSFMSEAQVMLGA